MRVRTVRELGVAAREARLRRGMTQADLADSLGVSREWVVRLEKGHPGLQAQLVLDAMAAAGLTVAVTVASDDPATSTDAFDELLGQLAEPRAPWPTDA
jgi:HTH-type transcriptional regulator/antitoxin HipB